MACVGGERRRRRERRRKRGRVVNGERRAMTGVERRRASGECEYAVWVGRVSSATWTIIAVTQKFTILLTSTRSV